MRFGFAGFNSSITRRPDLNAQTGLDNAISHIYPDQNVPAPLSNVVSNSPIY